MEFKYPEGATPINGDEAHALIPKHVHTQEELNAYEHMNIALALPWAFSLRNILHVKTLKKLHQRMFDRTWKWAGTFRSTQKNIGIESYYIEVELHKLCDDICFFIQNQSYKPDEIAVRFHHRLVWIHPFPNGNGRHARLACDVLVKVLNLSPFTWGGSDHTSDDMFLITEKRRRYIDALRKADQWDYADLLNFARS